MRYALRNFINLHAIYLEKQQKNIFIQIVLCQYEKINNSMLKKKMIICQLQGYIVSMTTYTTHWLMYTLYS